MVKMKGKKKVVEEVEGTAIPSRIEIREDSPLSLNKQFPEGQMILRYKLMDDNGDLIPQEVDDSAKMSIHDMVNKAYDGVSGADILKGLKGMVNEVLQAKAAEVGSKEK